VRGRCAAHPKRPGRTLEGLTRHDQARKGQSLSTAPRIDIDVADFWHDPYPTLARLRRDAPIALVPQLNSTLKPRASRLAPVPISVPAPVSDVALPTIFARLKDLRLVEAEPVRIGGWAEDCSTCRSSGRAESACDPIWSFSRDGIPSRCRLQDLSLLHPFVCRYVRVGR